jgi:pimeloyl-ACP methyl ester carboxylesterase
MTQFATLSTGPTIAYDDVGQGLPLVLGHGFLLDSSIFSGQAGSLSDRYRVITWHARGHGATEYDGRPFSLWDNARDLIALLDALGIDRAVIGGHSMGGFVALSAALLAPRRIAGLVLINTTPYGQEQYSAGKQQAFADAWQTTGPTRELCQLFGQGMFGGGRLEPWTEKWMKLTPAQCAHPFRAVAERDDLSPRLPEITAPALVVHGSGDAGISVAQTRQWASALPHASPPVVIDGAPHASCATHPEEVTTAIDRFLSALPSA